MKRRLKDTTYIYFYILFALCVTILSVFISNGLSGNDFWWHVKAGQWIVDNKSFPVHDMFSWYGIENNLKWTAHEWLSEVVFYLIFSIGGQIGIYVFCFAISVILLALIYSVCKDFVLNNMLFTVLFFVYTTILFCLFVYARPHIFSFIIFFLTLKILYDYVNNKSEKAIYFLPLLGILWANFHGGSSNLIYILPIFFIITGLFNFSFGKVEFKALPKKKIIKLALTTIVSAACICINPYGISMLTYPFSNMSDTLMLDLINEWASPDAKVLATLLFFFIPFALVLLSLFTTDKKIKAIDLLVLAFFSYMFLRSTRFIVFYMIATSFFALYYMPKFGKLNPVERKADKIFSVVIIGLLCAATIFGFVRASFTYKNGDLITHELDKQFVDLIKEDNPSRPYTDYNYGGDLIYYGVRVYVDGRADVYTGTPLADYYNLTVLNVHETLADNYDTFTFVEDILNKYNYDAFLIDNSRPLLQYLYSHPEKYKLVKSNDKTSYFKVIY